MQIRSIVQASLLHGAIIVGVGLSVQPWLTPTKEALTMGVQLDTDPLDVPEEEAIPEPVPVEYVEELEVAETELPEAPFFDIDPVEPDEMSEVQDEVQARFAVPERVLPSKEWLLRMRKREPVEPEQPVQPEVVQVAKPKVEAASDAQPLTHLNKKPRYPEGARLRGLEGDVVLLITVSATGEVVRAEIVKSAGFTRLHKQMNDAAKVAIFQWRYRPATRAGVAIETQIRVPIEFRLK